MKRCTSVAVALIAAGLISTGSAAGKSIQGSGSKGVENSLTVKLKAAGEEFQAGNLGGACADLQAFINESKAQSGKKLTEEQANEYIADGTIFRQLLGC
jgi:hypothetical protein